MAKSFKSTCEKVPVNLLKHITTHELLHKWLLKFSVRFFSPIYRSLFVSGKYILRSYLYSEAATMAVLLKRRVLRNFAKFTGKHCARLSFLIKLQALTPFLTEHIQWLLLYIFRKYFFLLLLLIRWKVLFFGLHFPLDLINSFNIIL